MKWKVTTVKEHTLDDFEIREERDGYGQYTVFLSQTCFAVNKDLDKLKALCEQYITTNEDA